MRVLDASLPAGDDLSKTMGALQKHYDMVRRKCKEMKAQCYETSYEKLFAADSPTQVAAWHDLIAFVQDEAHAAKAVTEEYVRFAVGRSPVHSRH